MDSKKRAIYLEAITTCVRKINLISKILAFFLINLKLKMI